MNYILLTLLGLLVVLTLPPVFASTGMSNCREEPDDPDCNDQPDRVATIMTMMKAQMPTVMDQVATTRLQTKRKTTGIQTVGVRSHQV